MIPLGLVRIGVLRSTAPYNWDDYKRMSGASDKMISVMRKNGHDQGSKPSDWWISFEPLHWNKWVAIEHYFDGETWRDLNNGVLAKYQSKLHTQVQAVIADERARASDQTIDDTGAETAEMLIDQAFKAIVARKTISQI